MSEKLLLQILDELKSFKESQQSMQGDIQSIQGDIQLIQGDIQILKDTAARIEGKQEIIYEHTARLSEYHTEVTNEIENVKDRLDFNTHKITETEREIFILKRKN